MKTLEEKQSELEGYSTIGDTVLFRAKPIGEVVDEVQVMSPGHKHCIERIHQLPEASEGSEGGEEYTYRFCHYALSENGTKVFGQYTTHFSQKRLRELLRLAHEKGWPILP